MPHPRQRYEQSIKVQPSQSIEEELQELCRKELTKAQEDRTLRINLSVTRSHLLRLKQLGKINDLLDENNRVDFTELVARVTEERDTLFNTDDITRDKFKMSFPDPKGA